MNDKEIAAVLRAVAIITATQLGETGEGWEWNVVDQLRDLARKRENNIGAPGVM